MEYTGSNSPNTESNRMMRRDRQSRSWKPAVEGVESRNLMSVGIHSIPSAMIHDLKFNIPAINGTIVGTVTSITPISARSQVVDYIAKGKANIIGDGRGSGEHTITSKVLKNHSTNDTYSNGSATLQGTTDLVSIHYTGTGHTNANGSFAATLHGTARSIAGQHAGLGGSFTAQLSGNNRTGSFTISFSIKV
jgi:hypothetical protein